MAENLSQKLFEFFEEEKALVSAIQELQNAEIHPSAYEPQKEGLYIRIGDSQSEPGIDGLGIVIEYNGFLTVQVNQFVTKEKRTDRTAFVNAREKSTILSKELARLIFNNCDLSKRVCDADVTRLVHGKPNVATAHYSGTFMLIEFNKR